MADNSCMICGVREAPDGHVCGLDRTRLATQLAALPTLVDRLHRALIPGGQRHEDRPPARRAGPAAPARIDVLSLLGPGTDRLSAAAMTGMLHPAVRRWRTVEHVTVTGPGGQPRPCEIVTWHQELHSTDTVQYSSSATLHPAVRARRDGDPPPHRILHDDQTGLVPPAAWAHSWARRWQRLLGHHPRPVRYTTRIPAAPRTRDLAAMTGLSLRSPYAPTPSDPLYHQWQQRFGPTERGYALTTDLRYLLTWLDEACDRDLDITQFAAQLRALNEELSRALGDRPDQFWLGRCPSTLTDRGTGATRVCGAGIFQDPYASQVACLRCRSTWGPAKHELIVLAAAIRREWPVDRRRRYTATEVRFMPPVPCLTCTQPVQVEWKEVTAVADHTRSWQPVRAVCPNGCDTSRLI